MGGGKHVSSPPFESWIILEGVEHKQAQTNGKNLVSKFQRGGEADMELLNHTM